MVVVVVRVRVHDGEVVKDLAWIELETFDFTINEVQKVAGKKL